MWLHRELLKYELYCLVTLVQWLFKECLFRINDYLAYSIATSTVIKKMWIQICIVTALYWLKPNYCNLILLLVASGCQWCKSYYLCNQPTATPHPYPLPTLYYVLTRHTEAEAALPWTASSATTQVPCRHHAETWMCLLLSKLYFQRKNRTICSSCFHSFSPFHTAVWCRPVSPLLRLTVFVNMTLPWWHWW